VNDGVRQSHKPRWNMLHAKNEKLANIEYLDESDINVSFLIKNYGNLKHAYYFA
jgi:hypothetical protein